VALDVAQRNLEVQAQRENSMSKTAKQRAIDLAHRRAAMNLRERVAMAICDCDTLTFHPMMRSSDGALHLPKDENFMRNKYACVCARDGRCPVDTIVRCANMLLKADAALAVMSEIDPSGA
jgi:hypothetical protein